jgi:hypothetical protein
LLDELGPSVEARETVRVLVAAVRQSRRGIVKRKRR